MPYAPQLIGFSQSPLPYDDRNKYIIYPHKCTAVVSISRTHKIQQNQSGIKRRSMRREIRYLWHCLHPCCTLMVPGSLLFPNRVPECVCICVCLCTVCNAFDACAHTEHRYIRTQGIIAYKMQSIHYASWNQCTYIINLVLCLPLCVT